MTFFKPIIITDPNTGKKRKLSPEEQLEMLEKGILLDVPIEPDSDQTSSNSTS